MIVEHGVNPILAVIIGIVMTTVIGFFNGYMITKTGIPPLIATLAMMTAPAYLSPRMQIGSLGYV
ncbi:MAG TPA: hypothetical protein GXZ37_02690 [Clostridiales bacterium]|nr:hypothetical protein [Clostridiales bacterium]